MRRIAHARLTGKQFERGLNDFVAALRAEIEAAVEDFHTSKSAALKRQMRSRTDFRFFCRTYFPHYVIHSESATHSWLYDNLPELIDMPHGARAAIAAPRGEGKSTIVSLQLVLWCIVTGRKHYVLLISDVFRQASTLLGAIKAECESNPRLRHDYPGEMGMGRVWRDEVIVTDNGVKVQSLGSGQRVRGLRHGPHRPDLVIGDDLENDTHVKTIEQRHKLARWWRRAVRYVGPPDGSMDTIVIGTVLHYDSLLAGLLKSGSWNSRIFRSIIHWPDRMELWDEFTTLARQCGNNEALAFYSEHKQQMESGARVSWPDAQPLVTLMLERAESAADFAVEKQNEPSADEDAPFAECIQYWDDRPPMLITFGVVDPSLGKHKSKGDPSAILIGGIERGARKAILYVLEASIRRRTPDRIISDVIAAQRRWGCVLWGIEAVQFQEYFRQQAMAQAVAAGVPLPARAIEPHTDKQLRIESLQPYVKDGYILLHRDHTTLIEQLGHYPYADHDDGPDALQMLWALASTRGGRKPEEAMRSRPRPDRVPIDWGAYDG